MSKIVNPYSHRLGIIRDWKSRWFGARSSYKKFLKSDVLVREYLEKKLKGFFVSTIDVERSANTFRVIIETSRPGMIIGRSGEGAVKLKDGLLSFMRKNKLFVGKEEVKIDIKEIRSPESNSMIVSHMIVEGLNKRFPFRRILKQTAEKVMANKDVLGVRISLSGMVGGGMARTEEKKLGRVPLQTFRADIDYAQNVANVPLGTIGVKVWIYKGEVFK